MTISMFLQVLACVLFLLAAANPWPAVPRPHFGWAGAFCWSLSVLLVGVH